jgi:peptide deformylase
MIFKIIPFEQTPKINQPIENLPVFISENKAMLDGFLAFAKQQGNGVGLAANQVSLNDERIMHRFFALKDIHSLQNNQWSLVFNPVIADTRGILHKKIEGCLTYPGKDIVVDRYRTVIVDYFDINTVSNLIQVYDFEAQIWQHEIDHLNGTQWQIEKRPYTLPKLPYHRNDKCPCNSGLKFKNCCLWE